MIPAVKAVIAGMEVEKNAVNEIAKLIALEASNHGNKSISNIIKYLFQIMNYIIQDFYLRLKQIKKEYLKDFMNLHKTW